MNAYHLFLLILFFYISFLVLTGVYFNRKQKSQTDFWLTGKSAGFLAIGFSAAASWLTTGAEPLRLDLKTTIRPIQGADIMGYRMSPIS